MQVLSDRERELQRQVLKRFRAKMTSSLTQLTRESEAIAKQFIPSPYEALDFGLEEPFEEGKLNRGIYGLERVYEDRAVLTPYFECSAYCRYCFKKTRTLAGESKRMSDGDIEAAIEYIARDPRIKTVLITGGDPLIAPDLIEKILVKVRPIPHVRNVRIGTRNILFAPENVTDEIADMIASFKHIDYTNPRMSKNVAIGVSLNHPDELTPDVVRAIQRFSSRGIGIRGQTVVMKGINDNVQTISELIELFLAVGIVPYYLLHCMPVVGTKHFRTSVQKGVDILRALLPYSGTNTYTYIYVTQAGKHRVTLNQQFDYVDINGERYIRATTPYKAADFLEFTGKSALPPLHEVNEEGYIVSHYLDGDDEELEDLS